MRSEGVVDYSTDDADAAAAATRMKSPTSVVRLLQALSPQQRAERRSRAKERRQLHCKVRKTKKYTEYFKACQQSLLQRLTSEEGKAFIKKTAASERRTISQVVERLVHSLEAQSVQQYASYYKNSRQESQAKQVAGGSQTATGSEPKELEPSSHSLESLAAAAKASDTGLENASSSCSSDAGYSSSSEQEQEEESDPIDSRTAQSKSATCCKPQRTLRQVKPSTHQQQAGCLDAVSRAARAQEQVARDEAERMKAFALRRLSI